MLATVAMVAAVLAETPSHVRAAVSIGTRAAPPVKTTARTARTTPTTITIVIKTFTITSQWSAHHSPMVARASVKASHAKASTSNPNSSTPAMVPTISPTTSSIASPSDSSGRRYEYVS